MERESEKDQWRHDKEQWQEGLKKGVGRGSIWRHRPVSGHSGCQWLEIFH